MQPVFEFIDLAGAEQKPFFLWYAPMMPHSPHTPPERLLNKYQDAAPSLEIAKYWAMCEWFDETCGQLLGHLDDDGLAETRSSSTSATTAGSRTRGARYAPSEAIALRRGPADADHDPLAGEGAASALH